MFALRVLLLKIVSCPCFTVAVSFVSEDVNNVCGVFVVAVCFGLYHIKGFLQKSDNP